MVLSVFHRWLNQALISIYIGILNEQSRLTLCLLLCWSKLFAPVFLESIQKLEAIQIFLPVNLLGR